MGERIILGDLGEAIAKIQAYTGSEQYKSLKPIVVLTSGDPLFYGFGRLLLEHFPKENLRFHPHVSSVQLAFSRLKIPWQDAQIVSAHGRSLNTLETALSKGTQYIAVLTDATNTPEAIARFVRGLQLPVQHRIWVCENLGGADEAITELTPTSEFSPLNVVVLEKQRAPLPDLSQLPILGIPDREFLSFPDRPGLMTKREVRVLSLSELELQPHQVIWDIGAGTGSVAIEIARLMPNSSIFAIEQTAAGITLIQQNCQRFGVQNVRAIAGKAPSSLQNLPSPHRIFLGGSSGELVEILQACSDRIKPGSILVANFASPEHLHVAMTWLKERGYSIHLLQINLSRSVPIGEVSRFAPLNPVTLLKTNF